MLSDFSLYKIFIVDDKLLYAQTLQNRIDFIQELFLLKLQQVDMETAYQSAMEKHNITDCPPLSFNVARGCTKSYLYTYLQETRKNIYNI